MSGASPRLDKWLWHARFFKSRTLASKLCKSGKVRVNGELVKKAHVVVQPGDVLTFPLGPHIRLIKILKLGLRRGPLHCAGDLLFGCVLTVVVDRRGSTLPVVNLVGPTATRRLNHGRKLGGVLVQSRLRPRLLFKRSYPVLERVPARSRK